MSKNEELPEEFSEESQFEYRHRQLYDGYLMALRRMASSEYPEPEMRAVVAAYDKYMTSRLEVCEMFRRMDLLATESFYKRNSKNLNEGEST